GSNRSMTSPKAAQSQRVSLAGRMFSTGSATSGVLSNVGDGLHGAAHSRLELGPVLRLNQVLRDQLRADAGGHDAGPEPRLQTGLVRIDPAGGHDLGPRHGPQHRPDEFRAADLRAGEHLDDL